MAIAQPTYVRRYNPPSRQPMPARRTAWPPRHVFMVGAILAGAALQHALVSMPVETQPVPLTILAQAGVAPARLARPAGAAAAMHPAVAAPTGRRAMRIASLHRVTLTVGHGRPRAVSMPRRSGLALTQGRHMSLPPAGSAGDARRVAVAANPNGAIMHVPSVSVEAIRMALRAAGSPALKARYADHKDVAEYIWDSGRVLGVDPAVVMAIFRHESVFGTRGMASLTNSVGNIRPLPGQAQLNGYRLYRSWQQGFDDCFRLLRSYARHGATTIPLAIPVWAPPSDNNDDSAYIGSVLGTMGALYAASIKA